MSKVNYIDKIFDEKKIMIFLMRGVYYFVLFAIYY